MTSILITVSAFGLMYLCCIRPMRRGHGATARSCCSATNSESRGSDEIARLSREVEALRKSMETARPASMSLSDQP